MHKIVCIALALCLLLAIPAVQATAQTANGPDSLLLPKPREVKWLPVSLLLTDNVSLVISKSASRATASTARLFADDLAGATGLKAQVGNKAGKSALVIKLRAGRSTGAAADKYNLTVEPGVVSIDGAGESGLYYGTRTFLQLAQGQRVGGIIPCCRIEDWPDYRYRMVHYDIAREQTTNMAYLKLVIDRLSYYKINMLHLYLENRFKFTKHPEVSPPGSMTAEQAKELDEYASRRFVELVPEVNTLGHMENMLSVKEYRHLAEDPKAPYELCASSDEGKKFVSELMTEISAPFKTKFLHVGGDETFQTATCPICSEKAKKIGKAGLYLNHFLAVHEMAKARGKRMMMWGDMLLAHPELADLLPKDIIIFDWHYENSSKSTVEFFRNKGFEVFACPATSSFGRIAVPYGYCMSNINAFLSQGSEAGAVGECTCAWELRMGEEFDNSYFAIALSAARAWNLTTDVDDSNRRFCKSFFGLDDTRVTDCCRMVSDGFAEICNVAFNGRSNNALLYLELPENIDRSVGGTVTPDLLTKALEHQKKVLDLIESIRRDCTSNRDALDFLDLQAYGWVHAVKRTLFYRQASDLLKSARAQAATDPKGADGKLAQADSLLDQILADLPYFEKRFQEAVERFGGSTEDIRRIVDNRKQINQRKAEIAKLRAAGAQGL